MSKHSLISTDVSPRLKYINKCLKNLRVKNMHPKKLKVKVLSFNISVTSYFNLRTFRRSPPEVFLGKGVLKICSKFTGEHPCGIVISINLLCNFSEITVPHGCSPLNLLHIFRTPFPKNTSGGLLCTLHLSFHKSIIKQV